MGTKMAPSYGNIFMHRLEQKFLNTQPLKPTIYKRYIDHSEPQLELVIDNFNMYHPTIKFTFIINPTKIIFLDLIISKTGRNNLSFATHYKQTNRFEYIHYSSAHLLKGELTRITRTTTDPQKRTEIKIKIIKHFKDRGYPTHNITSQHQLPEPQQINTKTGFNRLTFKTAFFRTDKIHDSLRKHLDISSKKTLH